MPGFVENMDSSQVHFSIPKPHEYESTMGILFQKSCFLYPDATHKIVDPGKVKKRSTRALRRRRRQQLNGIVDEARAWMYAILLPTSIIANGDATTKRHLDDEFARLTTKVLGNNIDHNKVDNICHKIANNILVPGIANIPSGSTHPSLVTSDMIKNLLDDRHIKAEYLEKIYDHCQGFKQQNLNARSWFEFRQAAGHYMYDGEPLKDHLDEWQEHMTRVEFGIPCTRDWSQDEKKAINKRIQSTDPIALDGLSTAAGRDLILVRFGGRKPPGPTAAAELDTVSNVLTLFPGFFDHDVPDGMSGVQMKEGEDSLHRIHSNVLAFLHELTHSRDVLLTQDHDFIYPGDNPVDHIPEPFRRPTPGGAWNEYRAYGLESSLGLVRRDIPDNLNKAEDNADNWAFYFALRVLMLAYPELDILRALETPSKDFTPSRTVYERKDWLHHCTLFNVLRHSDYDDFRRDAGRAEYYDDSKDWCMQEGNVRSPKTMEILLKTLRNILVREGIVR